MTQLGDSGTDLSTNADNVDYNELKNLIKVHTTQDQGSAIAIPGQVNPDVSQFADSFYNELSNQHDRVDLFVKDKAGEIARRLGRHWRLPSGDCANQHTEYLQTAVNRLLSRLPYSNGRPISHKKRERFSKYENQIER